MKKGLLLFALVICMVCAALVAGVLADDPELPEIILVSDSIEVGTPLMGTLTKVEPETEQYFTVHKCYDDGSSEYVSSHWIRLTGEEQILVPAEYADEPGKFRVETYINSVGEIFAEYTVTGNQPEAPAVTASATEIPKEHEVEFIITASGMTDARYRIFREDSLYPSSGRVYGNINNNSIKWKWTFYQEGEYEIEFQAKINGVWSVPSERLPVRSYSLGQIDTPDEHYATVPETLKAGQELTVLLKEVPHADYYDLNIYREDNGNLVESTFVRAPGAVCAAPVGLNAGNYMLRISCRGKGYTESESAGYPIAVTGVRPSTSLVTSLVSKKTLTVTKGPHETVWFTASATNLEACRIKGQWLDQSYLIPAENGVATIPAELDWDAEFTGSLYARINGCWTSAITVKITGTTGSDTSLKLTLPKSVQLGKKLTFTTELWDKAEYYTYSLSRIIREDNEYGTQYQQIVYEEIFTPTSKGKGTIPAQYFTQTGKWSVGVNAYGKNGVRYASGKVNVTANPDRPGAPTVRLEENQNPQHNADVKFKIESDSAFEKVCVIVKIKGEENSVADGPYILDTDGADPYYYIFNTKDFPNYSASEFCISASVCRNEIWSDYCEPVDFSVASDGDLYMDYNIAVSPAEAAPGDTVTVSWIPAEGAEWYSVGLDNERKLIPATEECSVDIQTEGIAAGTHEIEVEAYAVGKRKAIAYAELNLVNNAWKPTVSISTTQCRPNDTVKLTIKSTGGSVLFIYVDDVLYGNVKRSTTGSQQVDLKLDRIGTHRIRVTAADKFYPAQWSARSNTVKVNVTDSVKTPDIVIPDDVSRIGDETFSGVTNVKIWVPATVKFISDNAFDSSVTIVTPAGSYAATWAVEHGVEVIIE